MKSKRGQRQKSGREETADAFGWREEVEEDKKTGLVNSKGLLMMAELSRWWVAAAAAGIS